MASVEHLDDLKMTTLETLLQRCLEQREDIAGRILSSEELSEYTAWMVKTYGHTHGRVTQEMLPFFTPDNGMTALAAEIASAPDHRRLLGRLSKTLAVQDDEG